MLCPRSIPSTKRFIRSSANRAESYRKSHRPARFYTARVDRVFEPKPANLRALLQFPIMRFHVGGKRARSAFELAQKLQKAAGHRLPQNVFMKAAQMPADLTGYN